MRKLKFRIVAALRALDFAKPLYQATLGLKGNVMYHKNMLCEAQPSIQQISPIQFGIISKANNRAAFKMNFRFQDEKET